MKDKNIPLKMQPLISYALLGKLLANQISANQFLFESNVEEKTEHEGSGGFG